MLQKKGLITKRICSPTLSEPIPLKETTAFLLKNKEKEVSGLKEKADNINDNFFTQDKINLETDYILKFFYENPHNEESGYVNKCFKLSKNNVDFTTRYSEFIHLYNTPTLEPVVKMQHKCLDRGVKINMLIDKPTTGKLVEDLTFDYKDANQVIRHRNFQFRYTRVPFGNYHYIDRRQKCVHMDQS